MTKSERKLLLSIKVVPLFVFVLISIFGSLVALSINKINFNNEINKVKSNYIQQHKNIVKLEVEKIHNNIKNEKKLTEDKLKQNIKQKVYEAYSIIESIYKNNTQRSKKDIIKMIKNALRDVRFNNNRGYFFLYKIDGTALLLPPRPDLEGKNLIDLKDAKGTYTIKDMRDITKKYKEGFYTWWWYKPNNNKVQFKKIGFGKYFEPLDCFIGTGEYVKDFEESIKNFITQRFSKYKYGKNSYIFILDKKGNVLSHIDNSLIGKNLMNIKDKEGIPFIKDMIEKSKEMEGFVEYTYAKGVIDVKTKKISYIKKFNDWDWIIGSGFYNDDLDQLIEQKKVELKKQNSEQIKLIILISSLIILIVIIMSSVFSYIIKVRFEKYKKKVEEQDKLIFQKSKMAAMGEMLENIAHQWRQPLSVITAASTGMKAQKELDALSDEILLKNLDDISNSAMHLSQTIEDFRDFYKDDKKKEFFNIKDSINNAIKLLSSKFKSKGIDIILDIEDMEFSGYKNELIQVFMNLLSNSKDVFDDIKIDKKVIKISTSVIDDKIKISFLDNGGGIDESSLEKLFEYKYTTKAQKSGTGIGLYMSKLIIEKLKGVIKADNVMFEHEQNTYKGALFTIILPKT